MEGDLARTIEESSAASRMSSLRTIPDGTNLGRERSTIPSSTSTSTASATRVGSAPNTSLRPAPSQGLDWFKEFARKRERGGVTGEGQRETSHGNDRFHRAWHHGRADGGPSLDAGYDVVTSDHRGAAPEDLVAKGLQTVKASRLSRKPPTSLSRWCPTPQVAEVLFGENGVSESLSKGKLVIDISLISPIETKEFARKINASGATTSTRRCRAARSAPRRSLSIMVGGEETSFERAKPVFEKMGKNITLVGPKGAGRRPRSPTRSSSR